jgi:hypothetical protein
MAVKSRRLKRVSADESMPDGFSYCRKCRTVKKNYLFHKAVDNVLDTNGFFSVCKACANELYSGFLSSEGSTQKAILCMCRILNVAYNESAIEAALKQVEVKGGVEEESIWGLYRAKLIIQLRTSLTDNTDNLDLTYRDNPIVNIENIDDDSFDGAGKDLKVFWGENFEESDYIWLEKEYSDWRSRHTIDTKSQEELLKMIVMKSFDIRKARQSGKDASSLEKSFRELLNTSALSPLQMNAANSGENMDTFGSWIADIERDEPAQWLERDGKPLYKDVDNIEEYFQKYFVRPLRNFILQSKDFNITDETLGEEEFDVFSVETESGGENDEPETISK